MTTLYLARHGETEWNAAQRIMGQHDAPLTPNGEAQALELAGKLRSIGFARLYASPLGRAQRTAQILAQELALPSIAAVAALRERSYGAFEAGSHQAFREAVAAWEPSVAHLARAERMQVTVRPDVESDASLFGRATTALTEIAQRHPNELVLVVTHGGVLRTFLRYTSEEESAVPMGGLMNGGFVVASFDGERFTVESVDGLATTNVSE